VLELDFLGIYLEEVSLSQRTCIVHKNPKVFHHLTISCDWGVVSCLGQINWHHLHLEVWVEFQHLVSHFIELLLTPGCQHNIEA
jgi:hypothetical protein